MKCFVVVLSLALSASVLAAATVDAEVATNFPLAVNAARLERLTIAVSLESCVTNEVLVALGADRDSDGDLSIDEADIVFGCDCGAWYCADLRTGETATMTTNALAIGKLEFDSAWNFAKVVRRGFGEIDESVVVDEEHVRFDIRIR